MNMKNVHATGALFGLRAALLLLAACGSATPQSGETAAASGGNKAAKATAIKAAAPYTYPAPVKGHYSEINTGTFDLVDGLAYTEKSGSTVVYVTEKPIASPLLNGAACPMTQARALTLLRNSGYAEVSIDGGGRSRYFADGTPYGGRGRGEGSDWNITGGKVAKGRIAGRVAYRGRGQFEFDLLVATPVVDEVSEGDRVQGRRADEARRTPTEAELVAAYTEARRAARAGDLAGMLAAQGFSREQVEAIRGLAGIDADLTAHAAHFLDPGASEEVSAAAGSGSVGARGKDPKGAAFFNFYEFAPCGDKLVLVGIGENPQ
jgi:hypothetical protein